MSNSSNHSPLPWGLSKHSRTTVMAASGRRHVCSTGGFSSNDPNDDYTSENEANAELILKAVNRHDELLQALEGLIAQATDAAGAVAEFNAMPCDSLRDKLPTTVRRLEARIRAAREVLAKATGGDHAQAA